MLKKVGHVVEANRGREDAFGRIEGVAGVLARISADAEGGIYATDSAMFDMMSDVLLDAVATLQSDDVEL